MSAMRPTLLKWGKPLFRLVIRVLNTVPSIPQLRARGTLRGVSPLVSHSVTLRMNEIRCHLGLNRRWRYQKANCHVGRCDYEARRVYLQRPGAMDRTSGRVENYNPGLEFGTQIEIGHGHFFFFSFFVSK